MLTDPPAGRDERSPYDLLAEAGVGPGSSTKEILDASFVLMEQGRWSPHVRSAWDELRAVERRLAADFLRYDVDIDAEVSHARRSVLAALRQQARTSPAELCDLNLADLNPDGELGDITPQSFAAPERTSFDQPPPLPGPDLVEFDQ